MKYKINELKFLLKEDYYFNKSEHDKICHYIIPALAKKLRIQQDIIYNVTILKESIDSRKKPEIYLSYSLSFEVKGKASSLVQKNKDISEFNENKYHFPFKSSKAYNFKRPVIIGSGPAGLLCAYELAMAGYKPLIIERGQDADSRKLTIEDFWKNGTLNPESNVQYGEGGAGTFSDGKLQTGVKDKTGRIRRILEIFVECGAPSNILYDAKPHIGSDILITVIKNMRTKIEAMGGEYRFNTCYLNSVIENHRIKAIIVENNDNTYEIECDRLVLAIGHSARDTYKSLYNQNITMESKAFAVGLRAIHPQKVINYMRYAESKLKGLPTADYKTTFIASSGRGVYSFCMCPGGYVVNASSYTNMTCVNGMSYSGRNSKHSNSAIVITVDSTIYGDELFAGMNFQEELESKSYLEGKSMIPVQKYQDFKAGIITSNLPNDLSIKGQYISAKVNNILPSSLNNDIIEFFEEMRIKNPEFSDELYLAGVETRTSAPLKIIRDENYESSVKGLYPCGEGAGYAGGIISAALDGIKVAEKLAMSYNFHV